jgi:GTP cyclohydrolase I
LNWIVIVKNIELDCNCKKHLIELISVEDVTDVPTAPRNVRRRIGNLVDLDRATK